MSRGESELDRTALIAALSDEAGRKASTATILYLLAVAAKLGLSLTDLVCSEILARTGAITAGELAALSGLTTGAITGVVDRLEKAGFVRRVNDPNDRRRVIVEHIPARFERADTNPYHALQARFAGLYADYTDDELALLLDFFRKSITIYDEEGLRLRASAASVAAADIKDDGEPDTAARMQAPRARESDMQAAVVGAVVSARHASRHEQRKFAAPRGDSSQARLEWTSGPVHLYIRSLGNSGDLYRAEFKHDIPIVRVHDGVVSVQYRHRTLFGRGGGDADLKLNADPAWDLLLECGASHIEADLRELTLRGFELKSKASKVTLHLPHPTGTVRILISGSMSSVRIERPRGVPARLEFEGDWSTLRFDRKKMNVSNEIRESPNYRKAVDKYLIELVGGGSKLNVEESKQ